LQIVVAGLTLSLLARRGGDETDAPPAPPQSDLRRCNDEPGESVDRPPAAGGTWLRGRDTPQTDRLDDLHKEGQAAYPRDAQYDAIVEWGIPDHAALQRLTGIKSPTLVIQGDGDLMIPTKLSHLLAGLIPDARIRIYPDAAHGFLFQYPTEVASEVSAFLAR
jgi:pimeloyl-ACP methyl ester carboxylesterase